MQSTGQPAKHLIVQNHKQTGSPQTQSVIKIITHSWNEKMFWKALLEITNAFTHDDQGNWADSGLLL